MSRTIGERVRAYRLRRGLTQARLAHLIGRHVRFQFGPEFKLASLTTTLTTTCSCRLRAAPYPRPPDPSIPIERPGYTSRHCLAAHCSREKARAPSYLPKPAPPGPTGPTQLLLNSKDGSGGSPGGAGVVVMGRETGPIYRPHPRCSAPRIDGGHRPFGPVTT
jgi:hypothetical protein